MYTILGRREKTEKQYFLFLKINNLTLCYHLTIYGSWSEFCLEFRLLNANVFQLVRV